MAFEPGGYADKLGNRHEGRWVVWQLLRVLNEDVMSVVVEAIGDDEKGVDLWIQRPDGIREAHQCKARNKSKESWDITDLQSRGILAHLKHQLQRDPQFLFGLVTAIPATVFGDICESARRSNDNPDDFHQYQIEAIGAERRKVFQKFCEFMSLDYAQATDLNIAFGYLRRTFIHLWPDDQNSWDSLQTFAGLLVSGDPSQIIATLAYYAEENIRKTLTADTLRRFLTTQGFPPRNLSHDTRVAPAVEVLQTQFTESIAPDLVAGSLITRQETRRVLDALNGGDFVVIHGAAGYGKSGVLYELSSLLQELGHPYLPIRLDRNIPHNTTEQLGNELGLPGSPAWCLASLVGDNCGVLILDQLDALRWTSQHSMNSLNVCKFLVREIESLRSTGKQVSVVLACRTFDLEHDPEISKWLETTNRQRWNRIAVKGLAEEDVRAIVEGVGHRFSDLTSRQKQILQSPQHLGMWMKLRQSGYQTTFINSVQLFEVFWRSRLNA